MGGSYIEKKNKAKIDFLSLPSKNRKKHIFNAACNFDRNRHSPKTRNSLKTVHTILKKMVTNQKTKTITSFKRKCY
jgi:protein-arginine kinase activator protein McsA